MSVPATNGALSLTAVRARMAAALAPAVEGDPMVLLDVVDAVSPPCLLLVWGDPWLTPSAFGPALFDAELAVLAVASRVEPGPGVETLERLVEFSVGRLRADGYPWPQSTSQAPRVFDIGGVPYLGARIVYRVPVTVEKET